MAGNGSQFGPQYSWYQSNDDIHCFLSTDNLQIIKDFVVANQLSAFHDAELAQCTAEINKLISAVYANRKDPNRELSIIITHKGPFLVWSLPHSGVGPHNDPDTIEKALGI